MTRDVYTYFDALGDTGGLNGILMLVAMMIMGVLNTNKAENFMASRLYKGMTV